MRKDKVKEGGMARDIAFYNYFKNKSKLIKLDNNKLLNLFKLTFYLSFIFDSNILLHYPSLGIPISYKNPIKRVIASWFLLFLKFANRRNNVIFDVADLPYEQSIDLELHSSEGIKEFETRLFSMDIKLIFASYEMEKYACEKYNVSTNNTMVCINGGNELKKLDIKYYKNEIDQSEFNFVYAGTLNKGRQIEKLINLFSNSKNVNLILMGTKGEWIKQYISSNNIKYFGALDEDIAHEIVSNCDMGLIPYDSSRFYYNIAFPTKLSFYITAGIPFLSTKVKEVEYVNNRYDLGYTLNIEEWKLFIKNINFDKISYKKKNVNRSKSDFLWSNILKKIKLFLR